MRARPPFRREPARPGMCDMSSQTQGADSDRLTGLCDLTQCILDAMPYPVFVRDRAFRVVLSNRAADDYFQRSVIGLHCFEVRGGRAQPCDDCPARTAAHTGKPISREVRDPKSGEELNIDSYPIFDAAGEFVGLVEAFQVITRRKRTERKISELLAKLTRRNRELADRQQVMDSELELAREIQRRLLPGRAFEMGAFKCSFFYRPTGAVGGDIYDIRALDSERTALIMADAIGHGVPAALIAAMIHALFHSSSYDPFSPVDAPEGTAARPKLPSLRITSTSTLGCPLESRISRAMIISMVSMPASFELCLDNILRF